MFMVIFGLMNLLILLIRLDVGSQIDYRANVGEVLDVMQELAKAGMTMVVVTHEMGFAREVGTKVLFVDEGIIKEENTPSEFFANPKDPRLQDFLSKVL